MGRLPQERGVSSMSAHHFSFETDQDWWSRIGLGYSGVKPGTRFGNRVRASLLKILREHPPVAFAGGDNGATLSLDDFAALIEAAAADAVRAGEEGERITAETLREEGSARVEQAYAMPDADSLITEGRWAGLTKGEAFAWCWALFEYEPHGFVHPNSQVRVESRAKLAQGELPSVFGYPERAKELKASGLDPRKFREHQAALGARSFGYS